ncbi:PREDICTED: uncharacterized protein LOC105965355 [Erythranthe guttata]|uniref:uncharacterized protein LOC105965355 n=1 Tax=Erythranthe guttata TaxID=4155 RepID=UPI00064DC5C5|nr:PREDICTED: uncharacterized protein LOC105965355 [Erythranthe guttata]|eukprot:XP_012845354.1 PREDICTED: uncharacterized protein LOC105965355 [Erythranthe guttata]
MTLLSRIVRSCSRNHSGAASAQIFSRFGASTRFSSSIYTRSAPINTPPRPFSEQTMVRYGSSKRFYSSSSRSTSNPKRQLPLYESDVTHNKPWGYFLIIYHCSLVPFLLELVDWFCSSAIMMKRE